MNLNLRAAELCEEIVACSDALRVKVECGEGGARLIDCGVYAFGGLEAGRLLALVCAANLAKIAFVPGDRTIWAGPAVTFAVDLPLEACLASQYAGWQIAGEKFFAMGSGPMRAAAKHEKLIDRIGLGETAATLANGTRAVVGALECSKLPNGAICQRVASECGVEASELTLLVAPTRSMAGTVQVVCRSVETAMHKLLELDFDVSKIRSGFGVAPLPPMAANDLAAIGRTNDAVLYGGDVTLWIAGCTDEELERVGRRVPSHSSVDYGQPFQATFEKYGRDFYKIDPMLFSPAVVTLVNLDSGREFRFGEFRPDVLRQSFLA